MQWPAWIYPLLIKRRPTACYLNIPFLVAVRHLCLCLGFVQGVCHTVSTGARLAGEIGKGMETVKLIFGASLHIASLYTHPSFQAYAVSLSQGRRRHLLLLSGYLWGPIQISSSQTKPNVLAFSLHVSGAKFGNLRF